MMDVLRASSSASLRLSYKNWPRKYLFLTENQTQFAEHGSFRNWATRVWQKHLGQECTVDGMRKAWAQSVSDGGSFLWSHRKMLAASMQHTPATQARKYTKVMSDAPLASNCVRRWIEWQLTLDDPA